MNEKLSNDELDAIWDDESGMPPPMTAAQMDARLEQRIAALREERLAFEEQTAALQELIAQYEAAISELQNGALFSRNHSTAKQLTPSGKALPVRET
ncbi:MAG: hypothetical protein OHK0029_08660 [Armatimonadaceae bacterium]